MYTWHFFIVLNPNSCLWFYFDWASYGYTYFFQYSSKFVVWFRTHTICVCVRVCENVFSQCSVLIYSVIPHMYVCMDQHPLPCFKSYIYEFYTLWCPIFRSHMYIWSVQLCLASILYICVIYMLWFRYMHKYSIRLCLALNLYICMINMF